MYCYSAFWSVRNLVKSIWLPLVIDPFSWNNLYSSTRFSSLHFMYRSWTNSIKLVIGACLPATMTLYLLKIFCDLLLLLDAQENTPAIISTSMFDWELVSPWSVGKSIIVSVNSIKRVIVISTIPKDLLIPLFEYVSFPRNAIAKGISASVSASTLYRDSATNTRRMLATQEAFSAVRWTNSWSNVVFRFLILGSLLYYLVTAEKLDSIQRDHEEMSVWLDWKRLSCSNSSNYENHSYSRNFLKSVIIFLFKYL